MHFSKKPIVGLTLFSLLALGALFVLVNRTIGEEDPAITEDEAKAIAEEYTGGTAISVDLEREDDDLFGGGQLVYEVLVQTANGLLEVEIDANTGDVLEVEPADDDD
jgi:uncharacterized membrane protein YkoI